jgi:hypothetical protein
MAALVELVRAVVREGCVGETLGAIEAADAAAGCENPAVRDVLTRIAQDEAAHAALAWRTVQWACEVGGRRTREAAQAAFAEAVSTMSEDPVRQGAASEDISHLACHGVHGSAERAGLLQKALAQVVMPCARALEIAPDAVARFSDYT